MPPVMKRCSYCGAEYPDELNECPIDHESLQSPMAPTPQTNEHIPDKPDAPPEPVTGTEKDWVTILSPRNEFEARIVLDRLRIAGIRVRSNDAVMGGGINMFRMRAIQVRVEDFDQARELLKGE